MSVRVYRVVALSISAVLLIALVALLLVATADAPSAPSTVPTTAPSTTTTVPITMPTTVSPDDPNDGAITEAERVAGRFGSSLTVTTLNGIARLACAAAVVGPDREAVKQVVLERARRVRPNVTTGAAAALTDKIAAAACADTYAALPED